MGRLERTSYMETGSHSSSPATTLTHPAGEVASTSPHREARLSTASPLQQGAGVPAPTAASEQGGDLCQVSGRNSKGTREAFTVSSSVCRRLLLTLSSLQSQHTTSSRLSQVMTAMNGLGGGWDLSLHFEFLSSQAQLSSD